MRGNGEGTVRQRADGRWEARIQLSNGTRKSIYGKTRKAIAQELNRLIRARDQGLPVAHDERQTLAQYVENWLITIKPTIRYRTWKRYGELLRHVTVRLGKTPLAKLTPQQVSQLYALKLEDGLAPRTVRHLHTVLHHALDDALRHGLVQRNVTGLVDPPRAPRHEQQTLRPDEVQRLILAAQDDRLGALVVVAVHTGMRLGELLGLRWQYVDLENHILQVRGSLQRGPKGFVIEEPKTRASRRAVLLTAAACDALKRHQAQQLLEREAAGPLWSANDLVFCTEVGDPLDGTAVLRGYFYPLLKRAGLPRVRLHDLRHTAATLLLSQGISPKVVASVLGHATTAVTLDIYSHVTPDMQRGAVDAMQRIIGERPQRTDAPPSSGSGGTGAL